MIRKLFGCAIALSAGLSMLVACSGTSETVDGSGGSSFSRVRLYDSVSDLANDSDLVVVGTVRDQHVATDIDPITEFTLSSVEVSNAVLGSTSLESGNSTVVVREVGTAKQNSPGSMLKADETYLLFLTTSGLKGDLGKQYYVTGAVAGIFIQSNESNSARTSAQYSRLVPDSGDNLPNALSVNDIKVTTR